MFVTVLCAGPACGTKIHEVQYMAVVVLRLASRFTDPVPYDTDDCRSEVLLRGVASSTLLTQGQSSHPNQVGKIACACMHVSMCVLFDDCSKRGSWIECKTWCSTCRCYPSCIKPQAFAAGHALVE